MRKMAALLFFAACALVALGARSAEPLPAESDLDKRVTELAQNLRCLVCQNQTIADSQAPLAIDLKNQVREKLEQGQSNQQIIDYMVQRYGDFVLYRPPFKAATVLLWLGPAVLLLLGLWTLRRALRQRKRAIEDPPLSEDERARAGRLLGGEPPK